MEWYPAHNSARLQRTDRAHGKQFVTAVDRALGMRQHPRAQDTGHAPSLSPGVRSVGTNGRAVATHGLKDGRRLSGRESRRRPGRLGIPRPGRLDREGVPPHSRGRPEWRARDRFPRRIHSRASGLVPPPFRHRRALQPAGDRAVQELGRDPGTGGSRAVRGRARRQRLCGDRRLRKNAEHDRHDVQQPDLHRAGRHADRQAPEDHADRRRAAGAYGRLRRHVRRVPDRVRTDERSDLRRELEPASRVRAHRRRHPHSRHELAEPLSHQRRSLAQSCGGGRTGLRANEQSLRDLGLRHQWTSA